ncbi:MAG: hypothetical protein ACOX5R_18060 [bacterium]|jgi:hypothetical protein
MIDFTRLTIVFTCVLILLFITNLTGLAQEVKTSPLPEPVPKPFVAEGVYHISVRVIFGIETGIVGTIPRNLRDMSTLLKEGFSYPGYELVNTIRLSVLENEDAIARVFPDYYLRIIAKGKITENQALRAKAELYQVPNEQNLHTRLYIDPDADKQNSPIGSSTTKIPLLSLEERYPEGQHAPVFPILSSAIVLQKAQWEVFGGVAVNISANLESDGNRFGDTPLNSGITTSGRKKYLILGMKLLD